MNAPFNLKPGRDPPRSSESGSNCPSQPDLQNSSSEEKPSHTGISQTSGEIWVKQLQNILNEEFLIRQNSQQEKVIAMCFLGYLIQAKLLPNLELMLRLTVHHFYHSFEA